MHEEGLLPKLLKKTNTFSKILYLNKLSSSGLAVRWAFFVCIYWVNLSGSQRKMNSSKNNIAIIGAGNVGYHIARALNEAGFKIIQVISRDKKSAEDIGTQYHAQVNTNISSLLPGIDILLLTVPDHAIPEIVKDLHNFQGIVVHTSGSVNIDVFRGLNCPHGIMYPLQTFTKGRELNFKNIPIFVEASDESVLSRLIDISKELSDSVYELNSESRSQLHLAAVFANNFTNYMISAANDVLDFSGIPKEVLVSLLNETFEKSLETGPDYSQTGPAIRGDNSTIKKHLKLLSFSPELSQIYQCLTEAIQSRYNRDSGDKQ